VQALCPMGVRTAMLEGMSPAAELILGETAITAEEVADAAVAGIAAGSFLILPHPDVARMYAGRAADTDRWLRGMNRIQVRVEAAG
jgi:short-subunit dehydrogenase